MTDDLDPEFAALADEARRLEARVVGVSMHLSDDYQTTLIIETAGLTSREYSTLNEALKAYRRKHDLAAEFSIVNTTGGNFVSVPRGWPP